MKKSLLYLFMFVCSVSLFSSCGDDDDVKYPVDSELAGAYKGKMDVYYVGVSTPIASDMVQKVYISKASDTAIKLELKNFVINVAGTDITIGDIAVDNCALKQDGEAFQFSGSQTLELVVGSCNTSVSGTIGNGTIDMVINVDVAGGGMKVKVNYRGSRLSGNESVEAKITSFTFDSELVTSQLVIDEENKTITFKVSEDATPEELKTLAPTITVSDKATVTPGSGVAQNFAGNVVYTVVAEDGTTNQYTVSIAAKTSVLKFSFEEWENVPGSPWANEYDKPLPTDVLATSAEGAAMLKLIRVTTMPVYKTDDKKEGEYAIKLVTMDTSAKANALVPAITSGSVFTGKFDMDFLEQGKLYCTRFGVLYDKKPVVFKGWYKYTPGEKFIDGTDVNNIVEVKDRIDECAIQAVLYKVDTDDEVLTGFDINTSEKRVAVAALSDKTAKVDYTYFEIPFEFLKDYEEGAKYKLAIVCSSSKEGDLFKGAGGSTLILDELEVMGE